MVTSTIAYAMSPAITGTNTGHPNVHARRRLGQPHGALHALGRGAVEQLQGVHQERAVQCESALLAQLGSESGLHSPQLGDAGEQNENRVHRRMMPSTLLAVKARFPAQFHDQLVSIVSFRRIRADGKG